MLNNDKLKALRSEMERYSIDAWLLPSNDPHQSEYVASYWKSREWISGFTGSAGTLIITKNHAGLWTDSRYFLQAEEQLSNSDIVLHRQKVPHAPEHLDWLLEHLPVEGTLAVDGMLFSPGQLRYIAKILYPKRINLQTDLDLIANIWLDRPALPSAPVFELPDTLTGQSRGEKIQQLRKQLINKQADWYFLSTLDDIAWVLNLRGSDVPYNPVFLSYLVVGAQATHLYIDVEKVDTTLKDQLLSEGILLFPYEQIRHFLENLSDSANILIDATAIPVNLYKCLEEKQIKRTKNLPRKWKAIKTPTEIKHIRSVMIKDGIALLRLYRWLEQELESRTVTEVTVAEQLNTFRTQQEGYHGESFGAIVGYQGNGAIIHYRAEEKTCAQIEAKGILLLDSGGQYEQGTTDLTRTTALGPVTDIQKKEYTLVLKGHIALSQIQFPVGTTGTQLDTLARMYLWKEGLNYGHGTGHGVGFFLNVHEPPQGFATNPTTSRGTTPFEPGMLTSNEPGFYKTGSYGIRIENLLLCVEGEETPYGQFLKFETISYFPIDTNLIEPSMLSEEECKWLNDYHQKVLDILSPHLEEAEKEWLAEKCAIISL